jgi:hypothetical protein
MRYSSSFAKDFAASFMACTAAECGSVLPIASAAINAKHMQAVVDLWIKPCQRQIEMLNQQSRQLADLGQKMTTQSADTVAQNWNRAADTAGRNQSAF